MGWEKSKDGWMNEERKADKGTEFGKKERKGAFNNRIGTAPLEQTHLRHLTGPS